MLKYFYYYIDWCVQKAHTKPTLKRNIKVTKTSQPLGYRSMLKLENAELALISIIFRLVGLYWIQKFHKHVFEAIRCVIQVCGPDLLRAQKIVFLLDIKKSSYKICSCYMYIAEKLCNFFSYRHLCSNWKIISSYSCTCSVYYNYSI